MHRDPRYFLPTPSLRVCLPLIPLILLLPLGGRAAEWKDIATPLLERLTNSGAKFGYPGGCSGVVVDRLTGDVTIKVIGAGLWRSADQGKNWQRVDGGTIGGRDETGWTTSADAEHPARIVSFSLDGLAGWAPDGVHWHAFTDLGRNWDFGSVDWASTPPKTVLAAKHETSPPGEVCLSLDAGATWTKLSIHLNAAREKISMVGVMDASTLIYGKGDGIWRSTDQGATWAQVSTENAQTRVPVLFQGRHYLGTAHGLLVSRDHGVTWAGQGEAVSIWQGPFFGATAQDIAVVGEAGLSISRDGGAHWTHAASLKPKQGTYLFTANWFGCYAWDPVHGIFYASSMGNPVYALRLDDGAR